MVFGLHLPQSLVHFNVKQKKMREDICSQLYCLILSHAQTLQWQHEGEGSASILILLQESPKRKIKVNEEFWLSDSLFISVMQKYLLSVFLVGFFLSQMYSLFS